MRLILGLMAVLFFSCGKRDDAVAKNQDLAQELLFQQDSLVKEKCFGNDCARIRLLWPVAEENNNSEKINNQIQHQLIELINFEEEETESLNSKVNQFLASYQEFRVDFPESSGDWEIEVEGKLSYESENIISIYFSQYHYLGGAHPNSLVTFLNFDKKTGELLKKNKLIKDEKKLMELAEQKFREFHEVEKGVRLAEDDRFFLPDTGFFLPNAIGFMEEEFYLIYVPYEIASYAMGYTGLRFTKGELSDVVIW